MKERCPVVDTEQVFTIDELAAYLKVSKSSLYKWLTQGKVPGQKIGKHWRFSRAVIDQWLANTERNSN